MLIESLRELKAEKDEGTMDPPLFPRIHINDVDKLGPRPPPRNKMGFCEKYNISSQTEMSPPVVANVRSSSLSKASSSHAGNAKQKEPPTICNLSGSIYASYYPSGINFKTSLTNAEPKAFLGPINFQVPLVSCNSMTTTIQCSSSEPHGYNNCLKRCREAKPLIISTIGDKISVEAAMSRLNEGFVRKRCFSAVENSSLSLPLVEDKNSSSKIETIPDCKYFELMRNNDKKKECSETLVEESIPTIDLTPDDVIGAIGQKLFWKARKTIEQQQKLFAVQIFELHRLIKVQRLIAGSPELLRTNNLNLEKPSIKFPPINKLLYVTPLDPSPQTKPSKSISSKDHGVEPAPCGPLPPPINNNIVQRQPSPQPLSFPINNDSKLAPLFLGDQWLIPVRSPSEGLIYKPFTPPTVEIAGSFYGNSSTGTAFGVPAHGLGHFSGTGLGPSYFPPFAIPLSSANGAIVGPEGCSETSQVKGEALSLFPTTPSVQVSKDQSVEQKVQVIKVVPRNPKSAPESAARIFQSIQEERKTT